MKVIFATPYYVNQWESLGLGYIIAYCKKHYKGELEINFFQGKFDDNSTIIDEGRDSDIVAFSCTSPAYAHGLGLARIIKGLNPKVHIVFGGWHATALPIDVIKEDCVDQVIVGEGEYAMKLILDGFRLPVLIGEKLSPGELPWPDRQAIKNERTIELCQSMNGRRTASFQMNRGCKVHCKFCAEQNMTGKYNRITNPIRSRDIEDVLEEIESVRTQYNIDYFKFTDATFDKNIQTVKSFCNLKASQCNSMPWEANIHPGFVQDEDVFWWLRQANCHQINIGCESGSPKILKQVGKGTSLQSIKNVFAWAKEYGIKRRGYFLLGMPDETDEDLDLTEELIDQIEPDVLGFTILAPYPGSGFYDHKKYKDVDWSVVGEYGNDIWEAKYHTNAQLKDIQARLMDKYASKLCEFQKGING